MSSEEEIFTNELINESSPYLLQHAHNPVNWYPWGEKALNKAKEEGKLIIVSIGYAACHWCHVMEHESFEDSLVAATMNDKFISIKVDREERPDVDQVYMDAAQLMTGSGGWPLNIIALPDGRPVFAGTYFTKENWIQVLTNVGKVYQDNPDKVVSQAEKVQEGVAETNLLTPVDTGVEYNFDSLGVVVNNAWLAEIDMLKGGRKGQMKFPTPLAYHALLKYGYQSDNKKAIEAVTTTLNNMLMGGIYDQIGGGFARYSVDPNWNVPHFEKMLYDNAQLIWLYSEAYKFSKNEDFKRVVEETVAFTVRELRDNTGLFFSSLDADSEDEEGKFYVWAAEEFQEVLGSDAPLISDFYSVTGRGNWEDNKNVLRLHTLLDDFAKQNNMSSDKLLEVLKEAKSKLMKRRNDRIRPALDDKMLTSWNALMISGLKHAYEAFGEKSYLTLAEQCADFLYDNLWDGNTLKRNYKNDKASINGFIDDYSFVIQSYIHLYEATFEEKWLDRANELTKSALENYFDSKTGLFSFKSNTDKKLYTDKTQIDDSVIPSGNSAMAHNLFKLGHYLYNETYLEKARGMLSVVKERVNKYPTYYYNWFDLYRVLSKEPYEVAIVGNDAEVFRKELSSKFLPQAMLLGGKEEGSLELLQLKKVDGKTMIYVCQNKSCKLPVINVEAAILQMK